MVKKTFVATLLLTLALPGDPGRAAPAANPPADKGARAAQDEAFRAEVERRYRIFDLLTAGKIAYDGGDFATAVARWEALLALPPAGPGPDLERLVKPLLAEARRAAAAAGQKLPAPVLPAPSEGARAAATAGQTPVPPAPLPSIAGLVTGGGSVGPGGAVLWLKRLDGPTPAVRPAPAKIISQRDKSFVPHVLAIPVGTRVEFRNDDEFFHNVFSLSEAQPFDTGLYATGLAYSQTFDKPGPVELLCNIHANMSGYVYVVDSPYFTQPRPNGTFVIRRVPAGRYQLFAWHESALRPVRRTIEVGPEGVRGFTLELPADRTRPAAVPDKYGKPRQPELGY